MRRPRRGLFVAVLLVLDTGRNLAIGFANSGTLLGITSPVWLVLATFLVFLVYATVRHEDDGQTDNEVTAVGSRQAALNAIRRFTLEGGPAPLGERMAVIKYLDSVIPTDYRDPTGWHPEVVDTIESFVDRIVARPGVLRLVVTGPAGSGKSVLLQRIAGAMCRAKPDVAAIVVPLATYDWTGDTLLDWLGKAVSQIAEVPERFVRKLLEERRLLVLLDGLDEVPDEEQLRLRVFPRAEMPALDRFLPSRTSEINPRLQLVTRIGYLPSFVLAVRDDIASDEMRLLANEPTVSLRPISARAASRLLARHVPRTWQPDDELPEHLRTPLYLQLLLNVLADGRGPLPSNWTSQGGIRLLWDRFLEHLIAGNMALLTGWNKAKFRRWFDRYLGATRNRRIRAMSFERWPLLLNRSDRALLRVGKAVLSAGLIVVWISPFLTFRSALAPAMAGVLLVVLYLLAGEGTATRAMAARVPGLVEVWYLGIRQWPYMIGFTVGGGLLGPLVYGLLPGPLRLTTTAVRDHHVAILSWWPAIALGAGSGLLLGATVPALYELFYVGERPRPARAVRSTASACVIIGLWSALAVFPTLLVTFGFAMAAFTPAVFVVLVLLDSLGSPCVAAVIWAVGRNGPLRVNRFFEVTGRLGLTRPSGPFHVIEHTELERLPVGGSSQREVSRG
jgi:hypothetical protein